MSDYQELEGRIVQDFSTSVKGVVQDAIHLRQIASLYRVYSDTSSSSSVPANKDQQAIASHLIHMDPLISALEQKVSSLTLQIKEEEDHLKGMKRLHAAALRQGQVIHQVIQGCQKVCISFPITQDVTTSDNTHDTHHPSSKLHSTANQTQPNTLHSTKDHHHHDSSTHITQSLAQLLPITEIELDSISRNIRGRLPLMVINEALGEIIKLTQKKYDILTHKGPHYKHVLTLHLELQVQEHEELPWISEPELRKSCSFFRAGESTARSILLILRTLKRLKQVYGKGHQVTYICCVSG